MAGEENNAVVDGTGLKADASFLDDLLQALQRLDRLLERAVAAARASYGPEAATDPYRGLYISRGDTERLLAREPGTPTLWVSGEGTNEPLPDPIDSNTSRLAWLKQVFGLSPFDIDIILIALAPELDLRYERLYAYLQDDVTKKRPTMDLALNLLCPSVEAKLARHDHFTSDAPVIRHDLIRLIPDSHQLQPPLLAHYIKLDEQVVRLLLGQGGPDPRLVPFCQMIEPVVSLDDLPLTSEMKQAVQALASQARDVRQPLRLYFHGPRGAGERQVAEALASKIGVRLLVADLARAIVAERDFQYLLRLLFREAWFQDAILYLDGLDALRSNERALQYQCLLDTLKEDTGITILTGVQPWVPSGGLSLGVIPIFFSSLGFAQRQNCWKSHLAVAGIALDTHDLAALAGRFRLTPAQIAEAVATARNHARWRAAAQHALSANGQQPTIGDLFAAARAQSGHDLAALAHKIEPKHTWDDIVLPDDTMAQLREMCQRVPHRQRVMAEWGFDRKLSLGKGVNALFAGPSGTGKTMAAEIIANELGLDLYKIDLAGVVSKYIGETEKNLDRVFRAAESSNAILFFDEADALFGKRSEVRDSHDRYANIEISYLLQKMEEYDGVAILATNLRQNLDDSFVRRLAFSIHFPFPDDTQRQEIWTKVWPASLPLGSDVNVGFLAHQFQLSGGNIRNIALASAFLAAADGGVVTMEHLRHATQREYQKLGKMLSEIELYGARQTPIV